MLESEVLSVIIKQRKFKTIFDEYHTFKQLNVLNKLKAPSNEMKYFYQINEELEFFHFSVQNPWGFFEVTLPNPLLFQTTELLVFWGKMFNPQHTF